MQPQLREVAPHPLLRRAGAEADEEDVARRRVVGDPEVEEVGVAVARPVRVVQVHRALERVVEAEVAAVRVVDDREPVVARVLGEDDLQILRLDDGARVPRVEVAVAAGAEERRPVLRRRGGERLDVLRAERDRVEARGDGERARGGRRPRGPPRARRARGGEGRGRAEDEQLLDAELGDQPERRRERPDDAAGGRDRERRPAVRPTRCTACVCSRTAIGPTAESSTAIGRKRIAVQTTGSRRAPGSQRRTASITTRSSRGIASTVAAPAPITAASVSGEGKRSARAPPSQ